MAKKARTTTRKKASKKVARRSTKKAEGAESAKPDEAATSPAKRARLESLRKKIDEADTKLIRLLNERAKLVVDVGRVKRGSGIPIYAPHREKEVIEKALRSNRGPLRERAIEGVYRELMSGSFALERPLRIGYLGPPGSFSNLAAKIHFGTSVEFDDLHTIGGVFTEVRRGHVDYGLVPIENSTGGGVVEALDAFQEHARHLNVYAEAQIEIHHALLANCEPAKVRRIHSKPEIFSQCRGWLATQYPQAELIPETSSSRAAQIAAEEARLAESINADPTSASIGNPLAGEIYGLKVLFENIEDQPGNVTRFLVISRQKAKRSGRDKTSIMFKTADRPGALVSVLSCFEEAGINLTHIDKRPSGLENWRYTFFIDAEGHRDDAQLAAVLRRIKPICDDVVILGSYPSSTRVL